MKSHLFLGSLKILLLTSHVVVFAMLSHRTCNIVQDLQYSLSWFSCFILYMDSRILVKTETLILWIGRSSVCTVTHFLQNISTEFPFYRKSQTVFILEDSNLQSDNIFHDMEIPAFNSLLPQSKELCEWLLPSQSQLWCQSCHFLHYLLLLFSSGFMSPRSAHMILSTGLGIRFPEIRCLSSDQNHTIKPKSQPQIKYILCMTKPCIFQLIRVIMTWSWRDLAPELCNYFADPFICMNSFICNHTCTMLKVLFANHINY